MPGLPALLDRLESEYGRAKPPRHKEPLQQVLLENVAYLVSDEQREIAFEALRKRVGLKVSALLAAPSAKLREVAVLGGMLPDQRVGKLLRIAEIVTEHFDGDLRPVLSLQLREAKKALMKFPSIGEPGAEKILLTAGSHAVLALDSNGLRVLQRLGYGEEKKSYTASYRLTQAAATQELAARPATMLRAFQLLRRHGQTVCRRSKPLCPNCAIRDGCRFYRMGTGKKPLR